MRCLVLDNPFGERWAMLFQAKKTFDDSGLSDSAALHEILVQIDPGENYTIMFCDEVSFRAMNFQNPKPTTVLQVMA